MCLYSFFLLLLEAVAKPSLLLLSVDYLFLGCKVTIPAFCGRLLFNHLLTQDCYPVKELNW